ncbi:peptidyl-tRNA hydrolase protein 1 [Physocladia obscura]|uniref:peptidyl-tRNA hydrolase n=1 Tax=Physocladia obscura TaxID=109957 RepID=A0AAD5XBU9_9FUNG|nr:peptidyl-tRNA hydrolase protein 1 [Physocladia obscura]
MTNSATATTITKREQIFEQTLLVVGLGNTGLNGSRHNVGFAAVDSLLSSLESAAQTPSPIIAHWTPNKQCVGSVAFASIPKSTLLKSLLSAPQSAKQRKHKANTAISQSIDTDYAARIIFLKPKGFMNLSGIAVAKAAREFNVSNPSNVLVLHDELEKKLGSVTFKSSGSAAGHNGLRSVQASLRSDLFARLRIGIGKPDHKNDVAAYVLEKFLLDELEVLEEDVFGQVSERFYEWVRGRMDDACVATGGSAINSDGANVQIAR